MSSKLLQIDTNKTIYRMLVDSAANRLDYEALALGETRITYGQLISYIDEMACIFKQMGITENDTLAICNNGMPANVIALYAINKIGAKASLIHSLAPRMRFVELTNRTDCKYALMGVGEFKEYYEVIKDTPIKNIVITKFKDYFNHKELYKRYMLKAVRRDRLKYDDRLLPDDVKVDYLDKLQKAVTPALLNDDIEARQSPDDVAFYFHQASAITNQSTACVSSRAINAEVNQCGFLLKFGDDEVPRIVMSFVDKAYTFGLVFGIHAPLVVGHTLAMCNAPTNHLPSGEINYYRPNILIGYPSIINQMIDDKKISDKTIQSFERIYSGGDSFSSRLLSKLIDFVSDKGCTPDIYQFYGVTETISIAAYNYRELKNERAIGIPLPGVTIKIVEPNSMSEMPNGVKGEIAILTSAYINNYWEDEDSTIKLFRSYPDGRRWVLTGDMGHMDEDGVLYFDGNRKRCAEINGTIVFPHVVEKEIASIYGVKECCVVIYPDEDGSNKMVAVVVPDDSMLFDNDRLRTLKSSIELECSLVFEHEMIPSEVEFRASIPKGSYDKYDWYDLTKSVIENRRRDS